MLCHLRPLMLIALVMLTGQGADAQTAYEITPDSPIIVTPVAHTLVWQEPANSRLGIDQVLQRSNEFKPANDMGPIDAFSTYWVMQKFVNRLDADREYMLEGPGWLAVNSYILKTGKLVQPLKPFSFIQGEYSFLSDVDPAKPYSAKVPSQYPLFTLYKNEELVVVSQLKAYPSLPPKTFALRLIDKSKFGEVRRFGLYIEGALLGMLCALGIFGWFSYISNRDRASLFYGMWITIAFLQIFTIRSQDGSHFSEFIVNVEGMTVASRPIALLFTNITGYLHLYSHLHHTLFCLYIHHAQFATHAGVAALGCLHHRDFHHELCLRHHPLPFRHEDRHVFLVGIGSLFGLPVGVCDGSGGICFTFQLFARIRHQLFAAKHQCLASHWFVL